MPATGAAATSVDGQAPVPESVDYYDNDEFAPITQSPTRGPVVRHASRSASSGDIACAYLCTLSEEQRQLVCGSSTSTVIIYVETYGTYIVDCATGEVYYEEPAS